ncbi:MAG TPA: isoprenylcysteine carboxylmethyltransferase family protein [Candidatus Paceibacterota bacterium]|jgi:protein-S-isoprenylcysteine O-methyltransferase Ste14|nr:isoprenylcysteine carboxylmethyltransferase family protein [Candidatus Paceibacterota bacterium]
MEEDINTKVSDDNVRHGMVHFVLSHSYVVFLMAIVLGAIFNIIYNFNIFLNPIYQYIGLIMIMLGSFLIYWSQSTSRYIKENTEHGVIYNFEGGPYKYSRNPTHIGVAIMTLGLGLLVNSLFIIIFVIAAYIVTGLIFLKAEEKLLEQKYGQKYLDYKNKVKIWL